MYSSRPFGSKGGAYGGAYADGGVSGGSSLLSGITAYWKLDEASGTRADQVGGLTLTDNNTVTSDAKGGGAPANMPATVASFLIANVESLSIAHGSAGALIPTGAFTGAIWLNPAALAGSMYVFGKSSTAATTGYSVRYDIGANKWLLQIWGGGGTTVSSTTPSIGRWDLVIFGYDGTNAVIQVNNAAAVTGACSAPAASANGAFVIGAFSDTTTAPYSGLASLAGYWGTRFLSATERASLYNAGAAGVYPFTGL